MPVGPHAAGSLTCCQWPFHLEAHHPCLNVNQTLLARLPLSVQRAVPIYYRSIYIYFIIANYFSNRNHATRKSNCFPHKMFTLKCDMRNMIVLWRDDCFNNRKMLPVWFSQDVSDTVWEVLSEQGNIPGKDRKTTKYKCLVQMKECLIDWLIENFI